MTYVLSNTTIAPLFKNKIELIEKSPIAESEDKRSRQSDCFENDEIESFVRIKDTSLAFFLHELRAPLQSVLGWARLLQNNCLSDSETSQALTSINRNAHFLSSLIDDLLDVSRLALGKMELDKTKVNLRTIVEDVIEDFAPLAKTKNIALIGTFTDSESELCGDSKKLRQIIVNLISNALKFTPAGGYVTVDLTNHLEFTELKIRDSGSGIKQEFLPHIFECFQQDVPNQSQNNGLGIGLTIVRRLTELHGGSIKADSAGENQGATFVVKLPLVH